MVDTTRQVTLSTTAAMVIPQDNQRMSFSVVNMDTAITVYISTIPGVSSTNGFPIYPRTQLDFNAQNGSNTVVQRYMIAASGTPTVAINEEYR